jgi:hypothetical protein
MSEVSIPDGKYWVEMFGVRILMPIDGVDEQDVFPVPYPQLDHGPAQGRLVAEIHDGRYIAFEDLEDDSDG